jgi:ubiquinone/menaquinone biosynthesis C-methylase UbiE
VLAVAMQERRFRGAMMARGDADLPSDGTIIDVGCGTGTFAFSLASRRADANVAGVDGDAEILDRARAKVGAEAAGWKYGLARRFRWPTRARTW